MEKLATHCLPEALRQPLSLAAYWHDVGKLDHRSQVFLHQADGTCEPLVRSADLPMSPARRRSVHALSGLPEHFRHGMLSMQLVERPSAISGTEETVDLVLHLIASHHGYARPFGPVSIDPEPPPICRRLGQQTMTLSAEERPKLIPPYRLDSGIPDRFWRLAPRYGR